MGGGYRQRFGESLGTHEAHIYIKNTKKVKKCTESGGGCRISTGGSLPPGPLRWFVKISVLTMVRYQ